jgi:hypothetical protein
MRTAVQRDDWDSTQVGRFRRTERRIRYAVAVSVVTQAVVIRIVVGQQQAWGGEPLGRRGLISQFAR